MNDWPEGWSGNNRGGYGHGDASAQPDGARVMRPVRRGRSAPPQGGVPQQPSYGDSYADGYGNSNSNSNSNGPDQYGGGYNNDYNTGQVYGSGGTGGPGGHGGGRGDRPAPDWRRRIKVTAITVTVVVLATPSARTSGPTPSSTARSTCRRSSTGRRRARAPTT